MVTEITPKYRNTENPKYRNTENTEIPKYRNPNFSESIGIKFEFNQLLYDETFIETILKMPFVFLQNLEFRQFLGPYDKQSKMQSDSTMTLLSKSQTK